MSKRMEKERLQRELEDLEMKKKKCSRQLEYAQEILNTNQKRLEDIVTFELEKTGVLNRFQSLFICQRSVASMRYVLEGRVSGQNVRSLYEKVEEKTKELKRIENSFTEELEELNRKIRYTRERIVQVEQEIQMEEQQRGRSRY